MKKNLTKNIIAVIATLVLAIIIAPMFKAETAKAETAKVKYAFTKVRDKEKIVEGQVYCYITKYAIDLGNSISDDACLITIPAGAGVLKAELNGVNDWGYAFTDAKRESNRDDYLYPFRVVERDANYLFDGCGGCVYSLPGEYDTYFCNGGGSRDVKGNLYEYKEVELKEDMVTANLKAGVSIDPTKEVTLTPDQIRMSVIIDDETYLVPDSKGGFTLTDPKVFINNGDSQVTVNFGGVNVNIEIHQHVWQVSNNGSSLSASCIGKIGHCTSGTMTLGLKAEDGVIVAEPSNGWESFIGKLTNEITYTGIEGTTYEKSTEMPSEAGMYRATLSVPISGHNNEIFIDFAVNAKGELVDTLEHVHSWEYSVEDGVVVANCITTFPETCSYHKGRSEKIQVFPVITGNDPEDDYAEIGINGLTEEEKEEFIEDLEIKYTDKTGKPLDEKPTEPGEYYAVVTVTDEDGGKHEAKTGFTITEDGNIESEYRYVYAGTGVNYLGGFIDYSPREHVKVLGKDLDGNIVSSTYLDLTDETLVTNLNYTCYSTDGGKKYVSGKLDDAKLEKLFGRTLKLVIATNYNSSTKKPGDGATVIVFDTLNARPANKTLAANYAIYRDEMGLSNGQWALYKGNTEADMTAYEIGISDTTGKNLSSKGYGIFPLFGGVWVSPLDSNGRSYKETYYYRLAPTTTRPASKASKVKVSSVSKAPSVKVDYKKEELKLKENINIFFGDTMPDILSKNFKFETISGAAVKYEDFAGKAIVDVSKDDAKVKLDLSGYITEQRNTIKVWFKASAKKPATAILTTKLAARAAAPQVSAITLDKGKAKLTKGYEVYDESKEKWVTSVPKFSETTDFTVRKKADAKGGKENDTTYASGISSDLTVTYGELNDGKSGGVSVSLKSN